MPVPAVSRFRTIYGVDFSGAKLAGHNTWVAAVDNASRRLRLRTLDSLEALSGHATRDEALKRLVSSIAESESALWAMDFPFALPIEVMRRQPTFDAQLAHVARWKQGAYDLGLRCVERSRVCAGKLHIRRLTDSEAKTPFDCYHYRIIYQTFHGMRDVLYPLRQFRRTAILPFDYSRLARAQSVVIESCPGSILKRLGWPHNNYKQPTGGPLTPVRLRTRRRILDNLSGVIDIFPKHRRTIMRNPGADALDAVLAAVGAALRWDELEHRAIARHPRYRREGFVYA